jgi:hypothetical protein
MQLMAPSDHCISSYVGLPVHQSFENEKTVEHVDYNEKFRWDSPWSQGRLGYGPHGML